MKNLTSKSQKSQCAITAVVLGISILSGSHLRAATIYWDGITLGTWSATGNWSTASGATTPDPGAAPGASDDAIFNITTANNVNQEVSLNFSNRSANSILINNSGTTFFRRATTDDTSANYLQVGTGGFTISSTSGAVTLGQDVISTGQKIGLRAATGNTSLSITNNSSSLLTFNQPTQTRTNNTAIASTIIYAGSGSGGILQTGEVGKATASDGSVAVTVNMTGTGGVTFGGANTYDGATNVTAGTLIIGASGSLANTTATIGVNGTLAGGGTINGATTINGNHNPGFSPGTQTFTNSLTYGSTATLNWELTDNITTGRGTNYDAVNVSGGLFTLTTGATIDLSFGGSVDFLNAFWGSNQEWLVVDLSGSATAADSNLFTIGTITGGSNYNASLGTFGIERKAGSNAADSVYLTWTAIPEPTTALLSSIGMLLLLRRRRA